MPEVLPPGAMSIRAISLAILNLGSAHNPHVLRVRSGFSALSVSKLAAQIMPDGQAPRGSVQTLQLAFLMEAVFDNGGINIVFIDFDRRQQTGRNIFKAVVQ